MPRVRTRYFSMLRQFIGVAAEEIEVPENATLNDFIQSVVEKHRELRKVLFNKEGKLREGFAVAYNAEMIPRTKLNSRRLRDGDEVVIIWSIGGG